MLQCRLAAVLTQGAQAQGAAQPCLETPPKEPCRCLLRGIRGCLAYEQQHLPDANNRVWQRLAVTHPIQGVQALPCMQSIVPQQKRRQAVIVMPLAWWHWLACPQGIHPFSGLPRELLACHGVLKTGRWFAAWRSFQFGSRRSNPDRHTPASYNAWQSRAPKPSKETLGPAWGATRRAAWRQRIRRLRPPDPASFPLVGPRVQERCQESSQEPSLFLFHHELG